MRWCSLFDDMPTRRSLCESGRQLALINNSIRSIIGGAESADHPVANGGYHLRQAIKREKSDLAKGVNRVRL